MRRVVKKITPVGNRREIEVVFQPSLLASFFGATNRTFTYLGSGTVWYRSPSGKRVSPWMESFLSAAALVHDVRCATLFEAA